MTLMRVNFRYTILAQTIQFHKLADKLQADVPHHIQLLVRTENHSFHLHILN